MTLVVGNDLRAASLSCWVLKEEEDRWPNINASWLDNNRANLQIFVDFSLGFLLKV